MAVSLSVFTFQKGITGPLWFFVPSPPFPAVCNVLGGFGCLGREAGTAEDTSAHLSVGRCTCGSSGGNLGISGTLGAGIKNILKNF